jgi:CRP-like cAMP-binding protein
MRLEEQLAAIELFSELSSREVKAVGKLMTPVRVKPGRDIMVEGQTGREFVIITEGSATVRRAGRVLAQVGTGDFLGELSVIAGVPRTATVTADTDLELMVLNRREFSALLDENPKIARKVLVGAVKRIHQIEPTLTN